MNIDKIVCVGKNYLLHAKELGDAVPESPVIFLKPVSVMRQLQSWGSEIVLAYPKDNNIQPECEIVLQISKDIYEADIKQCSDVISAVTLGLDMTLRDKQTELKKQGHPWTCAKVFKDAAVIGPWINYSDFTDYLFHDFSLQIDNKICQTAKGNEMMTGPIELISYISHYFPLKTGDIIFTGTPVGVTSIKKDSIAKLVWNNNFYTVKWK